MAASINIKKYLMLTVLVLYVISGMTFAQDNCNKIITTSDYRQEGSILKIYYTMKGCPSNYKFDIRKLVITDINNREIIPGALSGDTVNLQTDIKNELTWDVTRDVDMLEGIKSITITTDFTSETKKLIEEEALQKVNDDKRHANSVLWVGGVHRFNVGFCVGLGAVLPNYDFGTSKVDGNPSAVAVFGGLSSRILFARFVGFQFDFIIQYSANAISQYNYNIYKALDFNVPLTVNLYFLRVLEFKTGFVFNKMISRQEIWETGSPSYLTYTYYKNCFKDDILFDVGLGLHIKKRAEWMVEYQRSIKNLANFSGLPFTKKHNNNLLFHFRFFILR